MVLLILALIWKWPSLFPNKAPAAGTGKGLAVVEIENMSGDRFLDWLGNGVAELLTTDLAQAKPR
jgi:TolB-like protein